MKKIFPFLVFSIATVFSIAACQQSKKTTVSSREKNKEAQQSKAVVSSWRFYVNRQIHIVFEYPGNWLERPEHTTVNRVGTTTSTEIQFEDTVQKERFLLIYHPAPAGESLYQYALQQYSEGKGWYAEHKKEMQIAGKKALVATSKVTTNGKGIALSTPLKSVVVVFLDLQNTGEYELQFTVPDDKRIDDNIQHVLSSIQLIQ
jgi:hypothetical protein